MMEVASCFIHDHFKDSFICWKEGSQGSRGRKDVKKGRKEKRKGGRGMDGRTKGSIDAEGRKEKRKERQTEGRKERKGRTERKGTSRSVAVVVLTAICLPFVAAMGTSLDGCTAMVLAETEKKSVAFAAKEEITSFPSASAYTAGLLLRREG